MSPVHPTREELSRAYEGRRVLVTGHTGFKGSWLTLWLDSLGARVTGFALPPDTRPALFDLLDLGERCDHRTGDVRDYDAVLAVVRETRPEVVFHLAAQPLVLESYLRPLETVATNVLGTAHVLEALRVMGSPAAAVMVTSDKCYDNRETGSGGFDEDDPMGGRDVYSMSKGASKLVIASYRQSFFDPTKLARHGLAVASARAGNVVGGGDWAANRITPDCVRALSQGEPIVVRNPDAVRPWQHVLEPLGGYLLLGARLLGVGAQGDPARYCKGWNFGPDPEDTHGVGALADAMVKHWGEGRWEHRPTPGAPHEARTLWLKIDRARRELGWAPRWSFDETVAHTVGWYRLHHDLARRGANPAEVARELGARCLAQLDAWLSAPAR